MSVPEGTSEPVNENTGAQYLHDETHIIRREANAGTTFDLTLHCDINEQPVKLVIDSGAVITVLSKRVYDSIPETSKPKLRSYDSSLQSANGFKIKTYGTAVVKISVNNFPAIEHEVYIADITDDGLLGMNFLKEHQCELSFEVPAIKINGRWLKLKYSGPQKEKLARVVLDKDVTVQSGTQRVLPGKVSFVTPLQPYGMIEPLHQGEIKYDVVIGRSVVDATHPQVGVPVTNCSKQHTKIKKGTVLGYFCPTAMIEDAQSFQESKKVRIIKEEEMDLQLSLNDIPEFLHDLYQRSSEHLNDDQKQKFLKLLHAHSDAFAESNKDLGTCTVAVHTIDTGTSQPIKQQPRRIPFGLQKEAAEEVSSMLEKKVVRHSNSPWSSPVVLVRKKDNSLRFCIDFRKLNSATKMDAYPLPRADACLDELAGSKFFSCMDLISGYWQLAMDPESIPKTAFSIPGGGHYEFLKMPFGLCGAPASFQRAMDIIMSGMSSQNVLIYLDDIILFSDSFDLHIKILEEVLVRLKKSSLKLKPKKCSFFQLECQFLGHYVSAEGVTPDPQKVEKVKDWPIPGSVSEVKAFLGLASYYRRFIKDFAHVAAPLNKLLNKEHANCFSWSSECQKAFDTLKQKLISPPVMGFPQRDGGCFILDTDASAFAVGAVLSQEQKLPDGNTTERVIAYASNSLNRAQRNYCTTRRELFAIKHFCEVFKHFLIGLHFKVRTDHASLKWLMNFRSPEGILARWLERLQQFSFTIEHRSGSSHSNADALSRLDPENLQEASLVNTLPCGPCKTCIRRDSLFNSKEQSCKEVTRRIREVSSRTDTPNIDHCSNWLAQYDADMLRNAQKEDPNLAVIVGWLKQGSRPNKDMIMGMSPETKSYWLMWDTLCLKDGILHKRWLPNVGTQEKFLLIVPHALREEVLQLAHSNIVGGHFGVHKTVSKIKMGFYWFRLRESVKLYVKSCHLCESRKRPAKSVEAPLHFQMAGSPLERVNLDMLGKLPLTDDGNQYCLVVTEQFSKYAEAFPTKDLTAATIANVLVKQFFKIVGTPYQIHTDQGSSFEASLFKELCEVYGIHKTRSSPARPQSNGQTEKFNATLCDMLSKFVSENQRDWDTKLPLLTSAYRSVEHSTTKVSPNLAFFGRELNNPLSLQFPLPKNQYRSPCQFVKEVQEVHHEVCEFVRDYMMKKFETADTSDNTRFLDHKFKEGDIVYWFDKHVKRGQCQKLARPWKGPFVVVTAIADCLYKIQASASKKTKVVHHNKLKLCQSRDIPEEVRSLAAKVKKRQRITVPKKTYTHQFKNKELEVVKNLAETRCSGKRPVKMPQKLLL